jgi:hypothetical protein
MGLCAAVTRNRPHSAYHFSARSACAIADRIELMGYKVEVHLIEKLAANPASKSVAKAA